MVRVAIGCDLLDALRDVRIPQLEVATALGAPVLLEIVEDVHPRPPRAPIRLDGEARAHVEETTGCGLVGTATLGRWIGDRVADEADEADELRQIRAGRKLLEMSALIPPPFGTTAQASRTEILGHRFSPVHGLGTYAPSAPTCLRPRADLGPGRPTSLRPRVRCLRSARLVGSG